MLRAIDFLKTEKVMTKPIANEALMKKMNLSVLCEWALVVAHLLLILLEVLLRHV